MPQKQCPCVFSYIIMSPLTRISTQFTTKMTKLGCKCTPERYHNRSFSVISLYANIFFYKIRNSSLFHMTKPSIRGKLILQDKPIYELSFACWVADICIPLFSLHFAVYTLNGMTEIMRFKRGKNEMSATFIINLNFSSCRHFHGIQTKRCRCGYPTVKRTHLVSLVILAQPGVRLQPNSQ